ncbi:MAG: phosphatase PAP2 family protein [Candidatus Marinimicrobia bacterium]|nr:phosphatase PAP2 family protein [Candidatus Neomarinimicrobiota bacterium]
MVMRKLALYFTVLLMQIQMLNSATPAFPNYLRDFKSMGRNAGERIDDFYPELGCIGLMAGILVWKGDELVRNNLVDCNKKQFENKILNAATLPARWYGANTKNLLYTFVGLTGSFYLFGKTFNCSKSEETSYLVMESFVFTTSIVETSKFFLGRARPFKNLGSRNFEFFNAHESNHSLPSGHTAIAFSMAGIVAMSSDSYWIKVPCYLWATSAGLQRIGFDVHWVSDVILGGLVGYSISSFLHHHYYEKKIDQKVKPSVSFNIVIPL